MSLFFDKCARCGSTDHSTADCPHGGFSTECARCGSKEHSADDCPHSGFSTECVHCGSKNHSSDDCPHRGLSTKCTFCGSKEHLADECPQISGSGRNASEGQLEAADDLSYTDQIQADSNDQSATYVSPLTSEDLQRLEIADRKTYVKVLLGVLATTIWVIFFGGYKFIAVLIVMPLLFKVFLSMPKFEPVNSLRVDGPNAFLLGHLIRGALGWAPFMLLTYLLITH